MLNLSRKEMSNSVLFRIGKVGGNKKPATYLICLNCKSEFGPVQRLKTKYCSRSCKHKAMVKPVKKIRKTHTFARSAQSLLAYHVKAGNIARPYYCEECGLKSKIEGAHKDYSRPLDVRWLCRSCHVKWDKKDPKNATYIVKQYTGKKATLELTGQTYEELKLERDNQSVKSQEQTKEKR